MDLPRILPLTPELIPAFTDLFGPNGACAGCWCTIFRFRPKTWSTMSGDDRREAMLDSIRRGPPPGLLAVQGEQAVGWMRIGPRAEVPEWNNDGRVSAPLPDAPADDPAVWAVSCFFFRRPWRGRGLSHALLAEGIAFARASGARVLEAAPMVRAKQSKSIPLYVGPAATFLKAGFTQVACRKDGRPLVRLVLGA